MTTTKEAALAALDAFDEKHQGPDYPRDYEETRAALVTALAEAEWEAIYAAINRLDATDDEKATLRFADWGEFEDEIEADADKTARERLAVLRAEDAENEYQIRHAEQVRQSTERVESGAVRS